MGSAAQQDVQADPMLVRCLTLHQTVLEHSGHGLTKEEIYLLVDGYAGRYREAQLMDPTARERELAALERRFSSDKQYLREAGIPLEESEDITGDHRYRIRTDTSYGLPDLRLTELERLVLHQAQLYFSTHSARGLQHAVWALSGAGDGEPAPPQAVQTGLGSEAEVNQLLHLSLTGLQAPMTFRYISRGRASPQTRRVMPLALGARGHWYLIAHDLDRDDRRVFRLDRIHDSPQPLRPRDLSAAERLLVERLSGPDAFSSAETEAILLQMANYREQRESLEGVLRAHTGPPPDPGRMRAPTGEDRQENIALKTDRVINMTAYLLASDGLAPSRLMGEYGISAEQLHRDLLGIQLSGPNVGMSRYVSVEPEPPLDTETFLTEYLAADEPITLQVPEGVSAATLHRPVSLTKPGALSLLIALKMLRQVLLAREAHMAAAARRVEEKVLSVVPEEIASAASAMTLQQAATDPTAIDTVESAISGDHSLQLSYTDADGDVSDRTVEPVQVLYHGPHAYLRAWCRQAAGERLFRFDRITSLTGVPQAPRSPQAHALAATEVSTPRVDRTGGSLEGVVLRFAPFAAASAQRYSPELQRRDKTDGSVYIRTHFRSRQAAVQTCLAAGGDVELIRPDALRQEVLQAAQQRLSRVDRGPGLVH